MSVVNKNLNQNEENDFTADNILDSVFFIFDKILEHTKNTKEKTETIFDHSHKKYDHHSQEDILENDEAENLSTASTTNSDDSSEEENEHRSFLDKYGIEDFVVLCYKNLNFNENLLILAMMNLEKILAKNFVLTEDNIHLTFFLCMMEVHKFYNDVPFSNKDYSKLCGINAEELLDLELEFLDYVDYNMNIPDEKYFTYKKNLKRFFNANIILENHYL